MTPKQAYQHCLKFNIESKYFEQIILESPECSYLYVLNIKKRRWKEFEEISEMHLSILWMYAKNVIKGRLPELMHNAMIAYAISDPNNVMTRDYFALIANRKDA